MGTKRFHQLIWVGVLAGLLGVLLMVNVNADALPQGKTSAYTQPIVQFSPEDPYYILGEPCGAGELLPDWTLCLHGGIALRNAAGQPVWLNDIPITITRGVSSVTGVTFIHPGYTTPTYGIDISPLWPEFLEPVTLTAHISGTLVERQIIVYPDFRTQNQRFDVVLQDVSALDPAPLWGYVADLAARGPVTGAIVTAERSGAQVTVTTSVALSETTPFYAFTAADLLTLGVSPGDVLTLTAVYQNDTDRQVIVLEATPQQVNFVTGWKCSEFDPLPRSSGGEGMPRSSGGEGMPGLGCFWGYVAVDGIATVGVQTHLDISNTRYSGVTQYYPGETLPRYGIGVWNGQTISGQQMLVTGVFSGYVRTEIVTVTLDTRLAQQVDLFLSGATALSTGPYGGRVKTIAYTHDFNQSTGQGSAWVLMEGSRDNIYRRPTGGDVWQLANKGLLGYRFDALGISPDCNESNGTGSIWAGARISPNNSSIVRQICGTDQWHILYNHSTSQSTAIKGILFSSDYDESQPNGHLYALVNNYQMYEYDIALDAWHVITYPISDSEIWGYAISPDYSRADGTGALYIAFDPKSSFLASHIYRLPAGTSEWEIVTNEGLTKDGTLFQLVFTKDGALWASSTAGVHKLILGDSVWQQRGRFYDYGASPFVKDLTFTSDFKEDLGQGYAYAATKDGIRRLPAGGLIWGTTIGKNRFARSQAGEVELSPDYNETENIGILMAGFYENSHTGIFEYNKATFSWIDINYGLLNLRLTQIDVSDDYNMQTDAGIIVALNDANGLFISRKNNDSWLRLGEVYTAASGGTSPFRSQLFRISPDFNEQAGTGSIWAIMPYGGSENIVRWPAGGTSWLPTGNSPAPNNSTIGLAFTPDYNESLSQGYVWVWSVSDTTAPPYRRAGPDGTWISVTHGLPAVPQIRSISVSPDYNASEGRGSVWASAGDGVYRLGAGTDTWIKVTNTRIHGLVFSTNYNEEQASGVIVGILSNSGREVYQCFPGNFSEWRRVGKAFPMSVYPLTEIALSPDYNGITRGDIWAVNRDVYKWSLGQSEWVKIIQEQLLNFSDIVVSPAYEHDRTLLLASGRGIVKYVSPAVDLEVNISAPPHVFPDVWTTVTLEYANWGFEDAKECVLVAMLPDSMTLVTSTLTPIQMRPPTWALGTVVSGTRGVITASVQVSPDVQIGAALTITAHINSQSLESYQDNNRATAVVTVVDPSQFDVGVSLSGPPILRPGTSEVYNIWVNNAYGIDVPTATLSITLSAGLTYDDANPAPDILTPLIWVMGPLPAGVTYPVILTTTVANTLPANINLSVTAHVTTILPDTNQHNNTAVITIPTTLTDAHTLILVASERLMMRYGATPLLSRLHQLAMHPRVRGTVLDILADPTVRAAYMAWDTDPGNATKANNVAEAIKMLIDEYTITYPNLRYLVLVGNDAQIPFYRVSDQNATLWQEKRYCQQMPVSTERSALCANQMLTDDFYANRTPVIPVSPFWYDGHPLYLPDFALGRLVETPEEMIRAIDVFLLANGEFNLGPALVGYDAHLTTDLGLYQCQALENDGVLATCTKSPTSFRDFVLQESWGSLWGALHSRHNALGQLSAFNLRDYIQDSCHSLLVTIGCHAGLNVGDRENTHTSYDLVQAAQSHGWPMIGPTAYAYASPFSIGYSEALAQELTRQMLITTTQEIGPALVRAKQHYYTTHTWFDYTDEKVLLPVTLYGLPMARVTSPEDGHHNSLAGGDSRKQLGQMVLVDDSAVLSYTLSGLTYTTHTTSQGIYLDYQGQTLAQDGLPVQPAFTQPIPALLQGRTPRGVWLFDAEYTIIADFAPVIAQGWAIGAPRTSQPARLTATHQEWDRPLPYALGHFVGLNDTQAALNLVLGAYNAATQVEQVFTALTFAVQYSDSADVVPPTIAQSEGHIGNHVILQADVTDESGVAAVAAVCDDGQGQWTTIPLTSADGKTWRGHAAIPCVRFYLQAADMHRNIAVGMWQLPTALTEQRLYLPLVLRQQREIIP